MAAPKSLTSSKPGAPKRRSPRGKIPAAGSEGREFGAHAEGGGFRPARDLALPIADLRISRVLGRRTKALFKVRNDPWPKEMLKMKEPPGMCMKTNERMTNCPAKYTAFSMKIHESSAD